MELAPRDPHDAPALADQRLVARSVVLEGARVVVVLATVELDDEVRARPHAVDLECSGRPLPRGCSPLDVEFQTFSTNSAERSSSSSRATSNPHAAVGEDAATAAVPALLWMWLHEINESDGVTEVPVLGDVIALFSLVRGEVGAMSRRERATVVAGSPLAPVRSSSGRSDEWKRTFARDRRQVGRIFRTTTGRARGRPGQPAEWSLRPRLRLPRGIAASTIPRASAPGRQRHRRRRAAGEGGRRSEGGRWSLRRGPARRLEAPCDPVYKEARQAIGHGDGGAPTADPATTFAAVGAANVGSVGRAAALASKCARKSR